MKAKNKNCYKISIFEQVYPLGLTLLITIIVLSLFYHHELEIGEEINSVISNVIVFVSIIIGFIGVLLGILLSLRHEERMQIFFDVIEKSILKRYFLEPMIAGVWSIIFGCSIFFRSGIDDFFINLTCKYLTISKVLICIWLFFTMHMIISTYRIVDFMFEVIFSNEKIQKRESISENEERKNELQNKYS